MKSRRTFLKDGALATAALAIGNPFQLFAGENSIFPFLNDGPGSLTVFHTNDLHNQLSGSFHEGNFLGGMHQTADLISNLRKKAGQSLLLDAGDIFNGNRLDEIAQGRTMEYVRRMHYDAVLLGNRDYETGIDYLEQNWSGSNITLLSSNTEFQNQGLGSLQHPYKIINKGDIRVGILAASLDLKTHLPSLKNELHYRDPIGRVNSLASYLKAKEKCQLIICLSHLGFKNSNHPDDLTLARQSENIDLILGGHSHTFMRTPHIVLNRKGQEVIVNHAGWKGMQIGQVCIDFDGYGRKKNLQFLNTMVRA